MQRWREIKIRVRKRGQHTSLDDVNSVYSLLPAYKRLEHLFRIVNCLPIYLEYLIAVFSKLLNIFSVILQIINSMWDMTNGHRHLSVAAHIDAPSTVLSLTQISITQSGITDLCNTTLRL